MNNSISSLTYQTNPLKEDPELKSLFKELETTVTSKQDFELWRNSFLSRFIEFLDVESTERAEQAYWKFSDTMSDFVSVINKLNKHIDDGNISSSHCSVKARQCLQEVSRHITIVVNEVDKLLPGTMSMEKKAGFTKFHIGAVLVRDGFREYARMSMCADVIEKMEKDLKGVADKLILLNMNMFICKLNTFCDVMADLGLLSALLKCSEYIHADDDEEQIRLSKLMHDNGDDTAHAYPTFDPNSSITLLERSNPVMDYEEEASVPDPAPLSLSFHELVPYSTKGAGERVHATPPITTSAYPTFDPDSSITLFDRSNASFQSSDREINQIPEEFADREPAPYGFVSPTKQSSVVKVNPSTLPKPPMDLDRKELPDTSSTRGNPFAPREPAPYGNGPPSEKQPAAKATSPNSPIGIGEQESKERGNPFASREPAPYGNESPSSKEPSDDHSFAPREPAPYGYVSPSKKQPSSAKVNLSTLPKPPMDFGERDKPSKPNPRGKQPLQKTDSSKPPTAPKPPLRKQASSASSTGETPSVTKPTGRVRWNPAQYYNAKNKPENKARESDMVVEKDKMVEAGKKEEQERKADKKGEPVKKAGKKEEAESKADKKEEPERKGLRSLFQRKPATKASNAAEENEVDTVVPKTSSLRDTRNLSNQTSPTIEPKQNIEENEKADLDPDNDDDEDKPIKRRKWSLNDFYYRLSKNKKDKQSKKDSGKNDENDEDQQAPPDTTDSKSKNAPSQQPKSQENRTSNAPATDESSIAEDASESSTMVSENEEPPIRQVNKKNAVPKSSQPVETTENQRDDISRKKDSVTAPKQPKDASKKSIKDTNASKQRDVTAEAKQQPENSPSTSKQAKQRNKTPEQPGKPSQPAKKQTAKKGNVPTAPSVEETSKQMKQPDAVQKQSSNTNTLDRPVKERNKYVDKAPKASAAKEEPDSKKPFNNSAKTSPDSNHFPQTKSSHDENAKSPPEAAQRNTEKKPSGKSQAEKKLPEKSQAEKKREEKPKAEQKLEEKSKVEKKPSRKERHSSKDEKDSGTSAQGVPETKSSTLDTTNPPAEDVPKKGIKNLFNRQKKKNKPNMQSGESAETVPRDRSTPSAEQKKVWDGVSSTSSTNKEPWDEKYKMKKKSGTGNEPLAICAAPPEDDDDERLGMGDAPLLAICAAEPEPEEISSGGNKPLLAICAAEPDDVGEEDAVSIDDVSESETMASDDEQVEEELESESNSLNDDEPYVDEVSDSETVVSEADNEFNNSNGDDMEATIATVGEAESLEQVEEENNVTTTRGHVDDVSESETVGSNDDDEEVVEKTVPTAMVPSAVKDHRNGGISSKVQKSNEAIVPSSNEHEKSDIIAMPQSTLDTTAVTPKVASDQEIKKEAKVLSEEERRKCYMWYDRMGRPTRDKMKQRIIKGMKDCDITVDDVDALPWMMRGAMISQSELNKLILK